MDVEMRRVWDPLYGRINLSLADYDLMRAPEMQRLRHIRMCNINSLLLTGASEISRFEHSLGVLRLAKEWISSHGVSPFDAAVLSAAALLHDVQSAPFGHSLQNIFQAELGPESFKHQDIRHGDKSHYYQDLSSNPAFAGHPFRLKDLLGEKWDQVADAVLGIGPFGPLISNSLDLDNLDNVVRLAYHAGLADREDAALALRLAREIEPQSSGISVSSEGVGDIERWQEIRLSLYHLLLFDWADFSAKAMLNRALSIAISLEIIGTDSWLMTDGNLLRTLEEITGPGQTASDIAKRLRRGDLYHPVYLGRTSNVGMRERLTNPVSRRSIEEQLQRYAAAELRLFADIVIYAIYDNGTSERSIEVYIRDDNSTRTIGRTSQQLLIGAFIGRTPDSERKLGKLALRFIQLLDDFGIDDLCPLDDPAGTHASEELRLL